MPAPRPVLPAVSAVLLSLLLAARALGPALFAPQRALPGVWSHPDTLSNHWLLCWVAEQAQAGGSLVHNDRYYWPVGDAPLLAGNGAEGFVYLPFHLVLGWPQAVPPYLLLILTLNGLAAWLAARAMGAGPWASLAALGVFAVNPGVHQHLAAGRFSQASVCWLLLFVAAWVHLLRKPTVARGVWAGLAMAATCFFYWYYGWFALLAAGVFVAARKGAPLRQPGVWVAVAVAAAAVGPWLGFHLAHWESIPGTGEAVFPHPESRLDVATLTLAPLVERGREAGRAVPLLTWLANLGGAGLALAAARRRTTLVEPWVARSLLACWLLFALLSFGPAFPGAPYTLVYGGLAVLRRFWWPLRHAVVTQLVAAVFAAWLLTALRHRLEQAGATRAGGGVVALVAVVLLAASPAWLAARGLPHRVPTSRMDAVDDAYTELAALPAGVLVEPPLSPRAAGTQQHLVYQRTHGKVLLTGHALWVDRVRPDAWDDYVAGQSLLAQLQQMEEGSLENNRLEVDPAEIESLVGQGVRWFSVNREVFPLALRGTADAYEQAFTALFGLPVLRGKRLKIWDAARYTGVGEVQLAPAPWPADLSLPPPGQPLQARRPRSALFPDAMDRGVLPGASRD